MMKRQRWTCLALCLALCILPLVGMAAIPQTPMEAFYVNDFADVISEGDAQEMLALGKALEDATGAQVVAVAVLFLDGMDVEDYGIELFNTWGLGSAEANNGVLLLVSIGDRDITTIVGTGLETKLPASVTGRYTDDYAVPYLSNDDFSTGIQKNYRALCDKVASIYGVSLAGQGHENYSYNEYNGEGETSVMDIIIGVVVLFIIFSIVRSIFRSAGNMGGCLFGWMLGRGARPRGRWHRPHRPPMGGGFGPRPPRPRPPGGRSTGGFGGGSSFGGGSRSGGSRMGGGGSTRGSSSKRKF